MTPSARLVSLVPGQRLRATLSAFTTLGEAADNDICLVGEGITARHARVTLVEDRWRVEPIDGAVSLNDAPVTGPTFLTHLDVLTLGASVNLVFTVGAAAQPAPQPQTPVPSPVAPPPAPVPPPVARPQTPVPPPVVRAPVPPPVPPKPAPRPPAPPARVDETVHMGALPQVPDALRPPAHAAAPAPLPPIEMGSATMYLTNAAPAGLSVPAFGKPSTPPTPAPAPRTPTRTPERAPERAPAPVPSGRQVRLVGQSGTWTLKPGRNVVGRSPDCQVCLAARHISREHAVLIVDDDGITIENAGARNGTTVNGTFLASRADLTPGDRVAFAGFEFELVVE